MHVKKSMRKICIAVILALLLGIAAAMPAPMSAESEPLHGVLSSNPASPMASGPSGGSFLAPIDPPDPNAIPIYTAQDLDNIRNNLSGSYVLMNDIDLSGYNGGEWVPIGLHAAGAFTGEFSGILDGQGYVISNLVITASDIWYAGLFGSVLDCTVKNVGLERIYIDVFYNGDAGFYAGGIAARGGAVAQPVYIQNCYSSGWIMVHATRGISMGGILGGADAQIRDCYNEAHIYVTLEAGSVGAVNAYGGGIAGVASYGFRSETVLMDCYNYGDISVMNLQRLNNTSSTSGSAYAGGICGTAAGTEIVGCDNAGAVTSSHIAGGICGNQASGISLCNNMGTVQAGHYGGGITGGYQGGFTVERCNNYGDISSEGAAYGISHSGTIYSCVNTGEIAGNGAAGGITRNGDVCYSCNTGYVRSICSGEAGGISLGGTVKNCYNTGDVITSPYYETTNGGYGVRERTIAGGISVGGYAENCYNTGAVSAYVEGGYSASHAGGILGYPGGMASKAVNCYNSGSVKSSAFAPDDYNDTIAYAGGINGGINIRSKLDDGNVVLSSAVSAQSADEEHEVCFIIGWYIEVEAYSTNNLALSDISGNAINNADKVISKAEAQSKSTYEALGWDFDNVWEMVPGCDYPQLRNMPEIGQSSASASERIESFDPPNGSADVSDVEYIVMANMAYWDLGPYIGKTAAEAKLDGERAKRCDVDGFSTWGEMVDSVLGDWRMEEVYGRDENGTYAVVFSNADRGQRVLAYRGSRFEASIGAVVDWVGDAIFGSSDLMTSQFVAGLEFANRFKGSNPNGYAMSVTGHSLGGGLAYVASCAYGLPGVAFNPAPMLDVAYYYFADCLLWYNAAIPAASFFKDFSMGASFRGTDKWMAYDYTNEHDQIGLLENEYRPVRKLKDGSMLSGQNLSIPHNLPSMILCDADTNEYSLARGVFTNTAYPQNWLKGMNLGLLPNLAERLPIVGDAISWFTASRNLKLGTSGDDRLVAGNKGSILGVDNLVRSVFYAGDGNDTLISFAGNDVLVAGRGSNALDGGSYDDAYVVFKDSGYTTITDVSGKDRLRLLGFDDFTLLTFEATGEKTTIIRYDGNPIVTVDLRTNNSGNKKFTVELGGRECELDGWIKMRGYNRITASCPVDMSIYDESGDLLLILRDGETTSVHNEYGHFAVALAEDTGEYIKIAERYDERSSVRITGTGEGAMDYMVMTVGDDDEEKFFALFGVPVASGEVFEVSADGKTLGLSGDGTELACGPVSLSELQEMYDAVPGGGSSATAAERSVPQEPSASTLTGQREKSGGDGGDEDNGGLPTWVVITIVVVASAAVICPMAIILRKKKSK